ncbi:hypothetical protein MVES_001672 [Malassezia vespertilionis]|uniref:Protein arginine methyltransferase NDUFAF7 n=2 Tax=Malassezia vespertilionis TaxID=2020962 RepID=A0A2N1JCW6_9BASI|nr:hypothetical protein MVES_001672 [Malassezia vespertilionis]
MQACLTNPDFGYYSGKLQENRNGILGTRGDFITSPEISQVFGELLAVYYVSRWQASNAPERIRLIELGPGRGTLLSDMLRTFANFPEMFNCLRTIQLVEASPWLLETQEKVVVEALQKYGKEPVDSDTAVEELKPNQVRLEWFPSYHDVPTDPKSWTIVTAHEFFDALPIHIFEKHMNGWREVLVDLDQGEKPGVAVLKASDILSGKHKKEEPGAEKATPKLRFVLSSSTTPWAKLLAARNSRFEKLQPGQRVEVSPMGWALARRMGEWVSGYDACKVAMDGKSMPLTPQQEQEREQASLGGCGLIIDYGAARFFSESFRAFRNHRIVDPLEMPGQSDLTANVDFSFLEEAVNTTNAQAHGPMSQHNFLASLGLGMRVQKLVKDNDASRKHVIEQAALRLVDSTGMGKQYEVMALSAPPAPNATTKIADEVYPFL